ncbi:MAG: hypothetical protein FJZ58_00795 [Chlamydiae bacterium]|nr:hypothetical protein [Chlamydiota bacterium]
MRKTLCCLAAFFFLFLVNQACKDRASDLSAGRIVQVAPLEFSQGILPSPSQEILTLLQQKYSYLGCGKQAIAFVSEDGDHVLKLFKRRFPKISFSLFGQEVSMGFSKFPLGRTIIARLYQEEIKQQTLRDFQSYTNAFTLFPKETLLEYIHLTKTEELQGQLHIYDQRKKEHLLDIDTTCFLLQKRTKLLYPTMRTLVQEQKLEEAKALLSAFVCLAYKLAEQNIARPTVVEDNYGCIGQDVFLIDVGRVLREDNPKTSLIERVRGTVEPMKNWLTIYCPALMPELEQAIQAISGSSPCPSF